MSDNKITPCTFGVCCKMCVMCSFALLHSLSPHSFLPTTLFWSMSRFNAASTHTWSVSCLIFYFMSSLRTQFRCANARAERWKYAWAIVHGFQPCGFTFFFSSWLKCSLKALKRLLNELHIKRNVQTQKSELNKSRQRGEWRVWGWRVVSGWKSRPPKSHV